MNFYPYNHENLVLRDGDLAVLRNSMGRLCGYCAFAPNEIPQEWHGDYNADALQYLAVHGGLTYCAVQGGDEEARRAACKAAHDAIVIPPESASLDERSAAYSARYKAREAATLTVPYTHVVFGFDCGHHGDENNYSLNDPQHVLGLARQMRQQLAAFARVIGEWRAADRDSRIQMVENITRTADVRTEFGFGAMIGMLGGAEAFGPDAEGAAS